MSYSSEVDNGSKEAAKEKKEGERRGVYHFAQCWAMTGHSKGVSLLYYYQPSLCLLRTIALTT